MEEKLPELEKSDGWQAWHIVHYFGFSGESKGKFSNYSRELIAKQMIQIDFDELDNYFEFEGSNEPDDIKKFYPESHGDDVFRIIKARSGQGRLRKEVLENYGGKCALCSIIERKLLVASHIKPWAASSKSERVDLSNCISLCKLHDALFEHGFISLDNELKVLVSENFEFEEQGINQEFEFSIPIESIPNAEFLKHHRKKHGFEKNFKRK